MEQDLELYCPQTAILKGIAYKDVTDTQIIDQALTYISNFLNEKAGIK
jgi:hypothetical protein